ncbi:hypothetical protein ACRPHS_18785 [Pantoea allii]|uniref:hypothetical protein n=1 Tax=Pantoea allii TaxID=574096 RepID=UPI00155FEC9E|nr:hypothetical protein [Pantoea allii]NQS85845.1 hypothetical protein [Pantoea allii]
MRCIGVTKKKSRCKNSSNLLFCKIHCWQPLTAIMLLFSYVGYWAGFYQDLLKPIIDNQTKISELRKLISIEVKKNRREFAEWEDNEDPTMGKSDVITILSDRQPIKSMEIYQTAKDQKFKDYLPTAQLADFFMPTEIEYQVLDLDGDGIDEIIIKITNRIYSLHFDKQVNILILNPMGEILNTTPYPRNIPGLSLEVHNPYSAYKTTAVMKDVISNTFTSSTFCNDFNVTTQDGVKYLQFSWVIDNSSYAAPHLHQVENYKFESGKLIPVESTPELYIAEGWENASTGKIVTSISDAETFLNENNLPTIGKLYSQIKNQQQENIAP